MAQTEPSGHGIVAVYPDLDAARDAMTTLESRGIDAVHIQLIGEPVVRAATDHDVSGRDRRVLMHLTARTATGAVMGAIVGVLLGMAVGVFASGPAWIYMLAGAVFLAPFGFAVGGYATLDADPQWELTFAPDDPGEVAIQVRTDDQAIVERASEALQDTNALQVRRL